MLNKDLNHLKVVAIIAILVLVPCVSKAQDKKIFHITNQSEFDQYSGFTFPVGAQVLFKAGEVFQGQFIVKGSGSTSEPNALGAFTDRDMGLVAGWLETKPVINGGGLYGATVLLKDGENWTISNLEVTNSNGSDEQQGRIFGVQVIAENTGLRENIRITDCYVHHVNGKVGGKNTGGISINVIGKERVTRFNNLLIENNKVEYTGGVGISNKSSWGNIVSDTFYPWSNFIIRNNKVLNTGRNGIIVRYATSPLVEYNTLGYNSLYSTGHSVFNFNTIDCVVQYNEAYGNTSNNPDDIDHGGFDADYNSIGTIIQYNYSHDNNWFCGIMRRPVNDDIVIRYNVSTNEQLGLLLYGFPDDEGVKNVKIYNNTFYQSKGKGNRVFVASGKVRIPTETTFINNIFYFEEKATWGFEPDSTCTFSQNLFYNIDPKGDGSIVQKPKFILPKGGQGINMDDPNRLSGFRLKTKSVGVGDGLTVPWAGGQDFAGNAIPEKFVSLGAFEIIDDH